MTPADLAAAVLVAARAVAVERGLDPSALAGADLRRPRRLAHGDYATGLALRFAEPRQFAAAVADRLAAVPGIDSVEVAGPGFLNLRLDPAAIARAVVQLNREYAQSPPAADELDRVRYAHARAASLLRQARDLGLEPAERPELLTGERERAVLLAFGDLGGLAEAYHDFQDCCRILPQGDEPASELTGARLWLVGAARDALAQGLAAIGVTAPERM